MSARASGEEVCRSSQGHSVLLHIPGVVENAAPAWQVAQAKASQTTIALRPKLAGTVSDRQMASKERAAVVNAPLFPPSQTLAS